MAGNVHLWAFFGDLGGIFVFLADISVRLYVKKTPIGFQFWVSMIPLRIQNVHIGHFWVNLWPKNVQKCTFRSGKCNETG